MTRPIALLTLALPLVGCQTKDSEPAAQSPPRAAEAQAWSGTSLATFAGGCFWCMETPFEELPGVTAVISGYTGGHDDDPTYEEVCGGATGHAEAVQVHFDPRVIGYEDLLEVFWRQIDPTDAGGQFVDRGNQYRSEIFYHDEAQREAAEASRRALAESGRFDEAIATEITPYERYFAAEEYHQDFHVKSPDRYKSYRRGSGRDRFLDRTWGDERHWTPKSPAEGGWRTFVMPSREELRERLNELSYEVTQEDATERAFRNEYWDNHDAGIYVDIVSGEPLFSSTDKFDSGTGWPSFTRPISDERVSLDTDYKLGYARNEVRSALADSHLGHVFPDGPEPTGQRWCINSAALRFVRADALVAKGYEEYAALFADRE